MNRFEGREFIGMIFKLVLPAVGAVDECASAELTLIRPPRKEQVIKPKDEGKALLHLLSCVKIKMTLEVF